MVIWGGCVIVSASHPWVQLSLRGTFGIEAWYYGVSGMDMICGSFSFYALFCGVDLKACFY